MYKKYDDKIDVIISKMSLREKIGQLNQPETPRASNVEQFKDMIRHGEVGSILMSVGATAGNDEQGEIDVEFYNELQRVAVEESPSGIPILFGRDVIHGHRTVLPLPLAMAASFDPELTEKCYADIAEEASNDSVHWTFTPMLDVCRDARWGRIVEGPGEDPLVAKKLAHAVVKGFQGDDPSKNGKLLACAKHFIGYGASEGGRDYHRTEISDYTLQNYYLPPFRQAVDSGVATVMSSFNDISGVPVSSSKYYLTDILRGQLGFEGLLVSDYGCVSQLIKQGVCDNYKDASAMALNAGLDMDMQDLCYINELEGAVKDGLVSEESIDEAVRRVLRVKFAKGLFEKPYCKKENINRTEHLKNARRLAAESMVLLKNDNNILPLAKNIKIALLGPFCQERRSLLGTWTIDGKADETPNLTEAMKNAVARFGGTVEFSPCNSFEKESACRKADKADAVVMAIGESWTWSGENKAVSNISLSDDQKALIYKVKATGKKLIGVFFCGRPIAMQGIAEYFDAIIYAWHSGSETANAVCDLLFGDTVPSGRLPVTIPRLATHIPLYYNVTSSGRPVDCYYGENPSSCYVDSYPTPYYPFGYGLSYASFDYGVVTSDRERLPLVELEQGEKFTVSINVTNTGNYDGKEVVQLYIRDPSAKMMRPIRELKGFKKILIKKGATANVEFKIGYDDLGYYLPNGNYTLEKGKIQVFIGENCLTKNMTEIYID